MTYLERYLAGEYERVWDELVALGATVRDEPVYRDALAVARETMRRVRQNVETIYQRLSHLGYQFFVSEPVWLVPTPETPSTLDAIERQIGPLPLSFRAFYEVVGSVNFCQSPKQLIQWQRAERAEAPELCLLGEEDPLQIVPLEDLAAAAISTKHLHSFRDGNPGAANGQETPRHQLYFYFAADEFHKANYSGGENYHVMLPNANADFRIQGMYDIDEYFVAYLRATCVGGGFRGRVEELPGDEAGMCKVSPQLKLVEMLASGLLPV